MGELVFAVVIMGGGGMLLFALISMLASGVGWRDSRTDVTVNVTLPPTPPPTPYYMPPVTPLGGYAPQGHYLVAPPQPQPQALVVTPELEAGILALARKVDQLEARLAPTPPTISGRDFLLQLPPPETRRRD